MNNKNILFDYDEEAKEKSISLLFNKLGLDIKLEKVNYVVIKPNFAAGSYVKADSHVVSNLEFIRKIIKYILSIRKNITIYIAESDSTGYGFAYLKFKNLGLPESLGLNKDELDHVKLLDLSRDELVEVKDKRFKYFTNADKQLWLSKTLLESQFVIDLTNLKTHSVTGYTGSCKNLFGTLYQCDKWIFHTHISEVIHDLTLAINPTLSIVDGFYGMEYNGPVAGKKIDIGFRVWGNNAVLTDIIASRMVSINYKRIKHLRELVKTEEIDVTNIVNDIEIDKNKVIKIHKPYLFLRIMNRVGLFFQRIGESIQYFGHRVHVTRNILELLVSIVRPILMKLFGIDRLKKIKKLIIGKKGE